MTSIANIQNGMAKYIDNDLLPHLTGMKKIAVGAYAGLALKNLGDLFNAYKNHPMISVLHVVDADGNIDIDTIYNEFARRMGDTIKFPINIPMVGVYSVDRSDLEKLYMYIKE